MTPKSAGFVSYFDFSSPPPEIYAQMSIAANAWDQLELAGRRLHFDCDDANHRARVEMLDLDGNLLFTPSPAHVLDLAAGRELAAPLHNLLDRQNAAGNKTPRKLE